MHPPYAQLWRSWSLNERIVVYLRQESADVPELQEPHKPERRKFGPSTTECQYYFGQLSVCARTAGKILDHRSASQSLGCAVCLLWGIVQRAWVSFHGARNFLRVAQLWERASTLHSRQRLRKSPQSADFARGSASSWYRSVATDYHAAAVAFCAGALPSGTRGRLATSSHISATAARTAAV